jgi:hypothetical protein
MAGGLTSNGEDGNARRPLWLAGLAGLLAASLLVWIAALAWLSWDNARLDEVDAFEGDGMVRPPAAFTQEWAADAALAFPRIALVLLAYALPLIAIIAFLERSGSRPRPLFSGALAMTPLALFLLALAARAPHTALLEVVVPILILFVIGTIGGWVAGSVRNGQRG